METMVAWVTVTVAGIGCVDVHMCAHASGALLRKGMHMVAAAVVRLN